MRVQRILGPGWVEGSVGFLWFAISVLSLVTAQGRIPWTVVVWDFVAFVALLVAVRWSGLGALLVAAVAVFGLLADPTGLGLSHYIGACAVVVWVRKAELLRAGLVSAVVGASLFAVMLRRAEGAGDVVAAVVAPVMVLLIAWLVGSGFRWMASLEADRVSKEFLERQMRMAVDIHDFVGRNLAGVRLLALTAERRSDPSFVDELVRRVQTAEAALREVTADLQREGSARPIRNVSAADALKGGIAELAASHMNVEFDAGVSPVLIGLPPEVDLVVSRIVAEALHNVAKYGDRTRPCVIEAMYKDDVLTLTVTNGTRPARRGIRRSLGLVAMRRHAALAGGTAESGPEGDVWRCRAVIPIARREGALT